jgi:hypothetical protein
MCRSCAAGSVRAGGRTVHGSGGGGGGTRRAPSSARPHLQLVAGPVRHHVAHGQPAVAAVVQQREVADQVGQRAAHRLVRQEAQHLRVVPPARRGGGGGAGVGGVLVVWVVVLVVLVLAVLVLAVLVLVLVLVLVVADSAGGRVRGWLRA